MIKLHLFNGEKDEANTVFVSETEGEKKQLTFDVIKDYALKILEATVNGEDNKCEIEIANDGLSSYKETMLTVFKSIEEDGELQTLYKEINYPEPKVEETTSE